ncbi:MAG: (4Fe-4S)-binding protein [Bacteroidetes bacterium RIFCSPHIGHO2_02_FULL_44_7]|nr:MAG: (4Fe-4S)-binding protein [Bacteroidetes bacterium RIFCSPHIGHO2_02_FULL_44_7]
MKKEYPKEDVTVLWDSSKCTHSANCVRGLPKVFKPKESPWVQVDNANRDEIVAQVHQCPSGALSIKGE